MTLGAAALASVLFVPLLVGLAALAACGLRLGEDPLAAAALAYVAGSVVLAALVAAWIAAEAPLGLGGLVGSALLAAGLLAIPAVGRRRHARARRVAEPPPRPRSPGACAPLVVLALLAASLGARIVGASLVPVISGEGDENQNWAVKAKLLHDARDPAVGYAERLHELPWTNPDYPLLNPLLQVWTFAHAGEVLHVENRFVVQLGVLALLALLAASLRRRASPWAAAALLLVVGTCGMTRRLAESAGADLLVALGVLAVAECGLRWRRSGDSAWLRAGALSLAFLVWTKNEGLLYGSLLVVLLARGRTHAIARRDLVWLALPCAAAGGTWLFNAAHGFRAYVYSGPDPDLGGYTAERVLETLRLALDYLFLRPDMHGFVPAAFVLACALAPRACFRGEARPLALAIVLAMAVVLAVYPRYPFRIAWTVHLSAPRVLYHLVPTMALVLAIAGTRIARLALRRARPEARPGALASG